MPLWNQSQPAAEMLMMLESTPVTTVSACGVLGDRPHPQEGEPFAPRTRSLKHPEQLLPEQGDQGGVKLHPTSQPASPKPNLN